MAEDTNEKEPLPTTVMGWIERVEGIAQQSSSEPNEVWSQEEERLAAIYDVEGTTRGWKSLFEWNNLLAVIAVLIAWMLFSALQLCVSGTWLDWRWNGTMLALLLAVILYVVSKEYPTFRKDAATLIPIAVSVSFTILMSLVFSGNKDDKFYIEPFMAATVFGAVLWLGIYAGTLAEEQKDRERGVLEKKRGRQRDTFFAAWQIWLLLEQGKKQSVRECLEEGERKRLCSQYLTAFLKRR